MKRWMTLLLSAILLVSLAACGGGNGGNNSKNAEGTGGSGGEKKEEKVELTFWTLGTAGYDKLVEEWNAAHPNIQVKVQNTGDQTAHHNNLITALSAGSGAPDIFMLEIAFMEKFIKNQDKFYNLYDLGAKDIEGNYLEWKWKQAQSKDGKFQIGLPTDIGPSVVYYRADLMEKAGIPSDPVAFGEAINTWDKFAAVGKQFTDKTGVAFVDNTDLMFNALRDQSDSEIYFKKEDDSFIGDTNPQIKKAYDLTVKAIQEKWIGKTVLWSPEWGAAMNEGKVAVVLGPAWMKANITGNAPDTKGKWKVTQLPEGSGNWGGSFLTIPKETKHSKEAYEFITWLDNQDQQLRAFESSGLMPSIPAIYDTDTFKNAKDEFFSGQNIATEFAKAAQKIKPVYYGPLHDTTDSYFKSALRNVIEKNSDPAAEWDSAVKQSKDLAKRGG
ncbi:sugar transporter [Paenibacillus sp. CAA11]|uniref:ABC transporter substrate-binding protein n=1 Tax=Paenibacillus sp. CAA11 TaxID=1532905 RepID=UPI000D36E964|nr:extracellular solute-binding protein [Paenibacillus sp. CAA11]AWB45954.1 sugar transporter [Paenibacillus sp. CAA11]